MAEKWEGSVKTAAQLRAATKDTAAQTPVFVEVDGQRRPVTGWRLLNASGPNPADQILVLRLAKLKPVPPVE